MMGSDDGMFFGGGLMWLFWLLIIMVIIAVIKTVLRSGSQDISTKSDGPLEILQKRYARGEIDEVEFNKRRKELED